MRIEAEEYELGLINVLNQVTSGIAEPEQWLSDALGGNRATSGVTVNSWTVLGLPAVWAACQRISGHMGILPVDLCRPTPQGEEKLDNHHAVRLLNTEVNEIQTPMTFRETMQLHALIEGNARAWIERDGAGRAVSLLILFPESTYTVMVNGEKWHVTYIDADYSDKELPYGTPPNNRGGRTMYRIPDRDVLHVPGMGWNGLWGLRIIDVLKDVFGLDKAGQDTTSFSFANNGRPALLLEVPKNMLRRAGEAEAFLHQFSEAHSSIDKAGKTGLLREGMKAHVLPLSASDAQHLESREFSRKDIALIFGTELVMGESSSQYKNLTERTAAYIQGCLAKWFTRWEQECNRKLLSPTERIGRRLSFKVNPTPLLTADVNSTADYTGKLRTQGIIDIDEARKLHKLNATGISDLEKPEPATQPPAAPQMPEADDESDEEDEEQNRMVQTLLAMRRDKLSKLLAYEARRVKNAAKYDDFLPRCEQFYEKFATELADGCVVCGMPTEEAERHCKRSQQAILNNAGNCTPDDLKATVAALVETWPKRLEEFDVSV